MTDEPLVRLRSRRRSSPSCAAACLAARPGLLEVRTADGVRTLRTGPAGDVVQARFLPDRPDPGHVALLDPDGRARAVLAVADWVPELVGVSPLSRGGAADDDELVWSGFDRLLDAAGVPVQEGRGPVDPQALVEPCRPGPSGPGRRAAPLLALALLVWMASLLVQVAVDATWPQELALGLGALLALALAAGAVATRRAQGRTAPGAVVVRPSPATPVTPRFARTARLALVPGPARSAAAVVVHDSLGAQEWFDGPAAPLGLRRAHVVTPPGDDRPQRVDLVDGLGREVVRLPWGEWFGGERGGAGLQALRDAGLEVAATQGQQLSAGLLQPSSMTHVGGLLELERSTLPALGPGLLLSVLPLVVALSGGGSGLTVALALVVGATVLVPQVSSLLAGAWYDRPGPSR